ncbi:TPA: hypothetical protein ACH3X2_001300 [Trebouxia sp. C0005]
MGRCITTPSCLAGITSCVSTQSELLGRSKGWEAETLQGNPGWRPLVTLAITLTKGYTAEAEEQGYQQKCTVPLSAEDIQ